MEAYLREGEVPDAHEADVRRTLAAGLHAITRVLRPDDLPHPLGDAWFGSLGARLWPRPHNALFDFEATARGAE